MKLQRGFTLIEMVAVIITLGILAATALPRFVNMSGDARLSALEGMAGAMNSARTMVKSKWVMANSSYQDTVDLGGGYNVSTISYKNGPSSVDIMGIPALDSATTHGIWYALDNPSGFLSAIVAGGATTQGGFSGVAVWPAGVAVSQDCFVFYNTSGIVTVSNLHGTAPTGTGCL